MARILVSGLLNLETTAKVRGFPIPYYPVDFDFFGVSSSASGVAFNMAKALNALGDSVTLVSMIGQDPAGDLFLSELDHLGISAAQVHRKLSATPSSVVLYDDSGRRQIYCDLKDIQETACTFSPGNVEEADLVVPCNINFSRPLIDLARARGKLIATDVHVLASPDDDYNRQFMECADILFLSDECVNGDRGDFLRALAARYPCRILVMGMGSQGALLHVPAEDLMQHLPARTVSGVINTVGAGDALFSAFLHYHLKGLPPLESLDRAQLFAALKIRQAGAAAGFVTEEELEQAFSAPGNPD